jgi:AcrR family transcriptional regulator
MADRQPVICLRKEPQQRRSRHLVDAVLEAAVRILNEEGSRHFTMSRIAERAGVSVGSLYQYFPNKHAVLFRLQTAEWRRTSAIIGEALQDRGKSPQQRLRNMVRLFFLSECEEAPFRHALAETSPLYRRSQEAQTQRRRSRKIMGAFVAEVLPRTDPAGRAFAAEFLMTTIGAMGARLSDQDLPQRDIEVFAAATADMLNGWLRQQGR